MSIFVLYADCGTGGLLQDKCRERTGHRDGGRPALLFVLRRQRGLRGPADDEITAFYLTDFLVPAVRCLCLAADGL
jgi:hypothetical protein